MNPEAITAVVPNNAYVVVGTLIVANIGTVISIFYGIGKLIWWLSKLEARVEAIEADHSKDLNAAFKKIRDLEINDKPGVAK
jgi:hypothetical protein